ncbi:MAG: hypothetical protein L0Z55_04545 [Planctomycetes bacterium]|nr:hypothetical protein [Planctomycetota bacterium]
MAATRLWIVIFAALMLFLCVSLVAAAVPYLWIKPQIAKLRDSALPRMDAERTALATEVAALENALEQRDIRLGLIDQELMRFQKEIRSLENRVSDETAAAGRGAAAPSAERSANPFIEFEDLTPAEQASYGPLENKAVFFVAHDSRFGIATFRDATTHQPIEISPDQRATALELVLLENAKARAIFEACGRLAEAKRARLFPTREGARAFAAESGEAAWATVQLDARRYAVARQAELDADPVVEALQRKIAEIEAESAASDTAKFAIEFHTRPTR